MVTSKNNLKLALVDSANMGMDAVDIIVGPINTLFHLALIANYHR